MPQRKQHPATSLNAAIRGKGSSTGGAKQKTQPSLHGKDAALASLLAATKPPTSQGQGPAPATRQLGLGLGLQALEAPSPQVKREDTATPPPPAPTPAPASAPVADQVKREQPSPSPLSTPLTVPPNRRPVFRPVLNSSLAVTWPALGTADAQSILHGLLDHLRQPQIKEQIARCFSKTKPKHPSPSPSPSPSRPMLIAGINSITRTLEHPSSSAVRIVYVCRQDLAPALVAHFPVLVSVYNARRTDSTPVTLVPLPPGAEQHLASALGLKRCAALALTSDPPHHPALPAPPSASWLPPAPQQLQPTSIKFLRTTAPADLNKSKAAKKLRRDQRATKRKARPKSKTTAAPLVASSKTLRTQKPRQRLKAKAAARRAQP